MEHKFALAEVKAAGDGEGNGEFEAILSAATLDRDGEVIDKGAFEPLPDSIPIHAFHDFRDPVGRAQPFYDGDVLKVRGFYAGTPRAQEIRQLVAEGVIASMSVGFMDAARTEQDKVPHITKAEILEGSFVSIPSNREAQVLLAKEYADLKVGARNSTEDASRLQQIHDLAVTNGAACEAKHVSVAAALAAAMTPAEIRALEADTKSTESTDPEQAAAVQAAAAPADVGRSKAQVALARARLAQAAAL